MGDGSRGDWTAINYFKDSGGLKGRQGEMVAARKVFIHECNTGRSTVDQCMSSDHLGVVGQGARYNKMLSFHLIENFYTGN